MKLSSLKGVEPPRPYLPLQFVKLEGPFSEDLDDAEGNGHEAACLMGDIRGSKRGLRLTVFPGVK
jgi:hypothetical protein